MASNRNLPLESAGGPERGSAGVRELESLGVHVKRVERPTEEREAQKILSRAFQEKMTVLPCGGGTSLGAGLLPESVDIALDMTGMDRVLAFDPGNLNLAVLAGMTLDQINGYLGRQGGGFFLPLDPPSSHRATIGGVYAANASGPSRLRYGTVRDQVLGVRGVDAQGREVGFGGKTVKNVSGYDLTKFFIGSAGSLCLITSISSRVFPLPESSSLCDFIFGGFEELEKFLAALRSSVLIPSAVVVSELAGGPGVSDSLSSRFRVLVSVEGHSQAVDRQNRDLLKMAGKFGGRGETRLGRDIMGQGLRSVIDPERMTPDFLALKVSVPIARGPSAYASIVKLCRDCGVQSRTVLLAGNGVISLHAVGTNSQGASRLITGVKEIAQATSGYVSPVRAHRHLLASWGPRVDPVLQRAVLQPLKEKLDPTGVFPPIL